MRGVLRAGFASVGVGVGVCGFVALCGVLRSEAGRFRAYVRGRFGAWLEVRE